MARVWITCGLAATMVVLAFLFFGGDGKGGSRPARPRPPSPLAEEEIRVYLAVMPEFRAALEKSASDAIREMIAREGKVDEEALRQLAPPQIDATLEKHHLSRESWKKLQDRVEYAVNAVRAEQELRGRRREIEEEIRLKRETLSRVSDPKDKALLEEEIRLSEARLKAEPPPLLEHDRDLTGQYWRDLDRWAPRRGVPPK